jgi:hypothetical protein
MYSKRNIKMRYLSFKMNNSSFRKVWTSSNRTESWKKHRFLRFSKQMLKWISKDEQHNKNSADRRLEVLCRPDKQSVDFMKALWTILEKNVFKVFQNSLIPESIADCVSGEEQCLDNKFSLIPRVSYVIPNFANFSYILYNVSPIFNW